MAAWTPEKDDLWIVDRAGGARLWGNLQQLPLDVAANASALDAALRAEL